jgi:hypothetical protein
MPIEVVCPSCARQFRVPDKVAGKKIKCPKCAGVLPVPGGPDSGTGSTDAGGNSPGSGSGVAASPSAWYLKTPDGNQYGPVPRAELDQWFGEGRVTAQCQLLKQGASQWQWASDIYPQLNNAAATTSQTVASSSVAMQAPAQVGSENPFAGLRTSNSESSSISSGTAPTPADGTSGGDPFSFAGANTSPAARVRGAKRGGSPRRGKAARTSGKAIVTAVAIVNYVIGALGVILGLLLAVMGSVIMSMFMGAVQGEIANSGDPNSAEAAQAAGLIGTFGTAIFVAVGVVFIISSCIMLLAGYGVQIRAHWGRILTLVLGGFNVLAGIVVLLVLSPTAIVHIGYAIFVFVVLLNKQNAEEFG